MDRLSSARGALPAVGIDALVISPGPDLRYLTGYDALPLERLTALVLPAAGDPALVVPRLERPAAEASPAGDLGIEIIAWDETDDPYALVAGLVPGAGAIGVDSRMWAEKLLRLGVAMPAATWRLATEVIGPLRRRKSAEEVDALATAGSAIDSVHAAMGEWLRPGRTERDVARDIADAILSAGHARVDFVIVASGPNGASPHHEVSSRVIEPGDAVVVDIGGTMPSGYCSDETRTYAVGDPGPAYRARYDVLQAAQAAAVAAVRPGIACSALDSVARDVLTEAGLGEAFLHRTGHGIGLETHEEPYIVAGNESPLAPGDAFSIEPGFYLSGVHGARIEDIVVCGTDGALVMNHRPRDLMIVGD